MRSLQRVFKWLLIVVLLVVVSLAVYYFLWPSGSRSTLSVVPRNAAFVMETEDPFGSYREIANSKLWRHLLSNAYFEELDQSMKELDAIIAENELMLELFASRALTLSVHKTKPNDFDFLYIVDLENESKIAQFNTSLAPYLAGTGLTLDREDYGEDELLLLRDEETNDVLFLALIENVMAASYTRSLVEQAIADKDSNFIENNPTFLKLNESLGTGGMFNLYINGLELDNFLGLYTDDEGLLGALGETLDWSGLELELAREQFTLAGDLYVQDSTSSYLHALLAAGAGRHYAENICTQRAGMYLSLGFDNFLDLYDNLLDRYARFNDDWDAYKQDLNDVESFLDINLRRDFLSWFGNEIAVVLAEPKVRTRAEDRLLLIHTRDLAIARASLERISNNIRKKTLVTRFKPVSYRTHTIYKFDAKGFFKLFLGKLLDKFDKPYFTYLEDFVVFSNDLTTLHHFLDDYAADLTLAKSAVYQPFREDFDDRGNVFVYLDYARLHPLMRSFVDGETWVNMSQNKDYLQGFRQTGLQLTGSSERRFETEIRISYSQMEARDLSLYAEQAAALAADTSESDSVLAPEYGNGTTFPPGLNEEFHDDAGSKLKRRFFVMEGLFEGAYTEYWRNGNLKVMGQYQKGQRVGEWEFYSRRGKLKDKTDFGEYQPVEEAL